MAKRKPNKRNRNKQIKKQQNKKLVSTGLTEKQVKRMTPTERKKTVKTVERKEQRTVNRQQKKKFLETNNINKNYIINGKKYTPSQLADLSWNTLETLAEREKINERKRQQRLQRQETKIQQLVDNGFDFAQASRYKNVSYKEIEHLIFMGDRTVYKADMYLSVMWADVTGESQWSLALTNHDNHSTQQMIEIIHNIRDNLQKGGSGRFTGVPSVSVGRDKNELRQHVQGKFFNGYNKLMVTENNRIFASNEWTLRGFANMMLSVMEHTSDDLIHGFYDDMENYCYKYLPEIYKQIFL